MKRVKLADILRGGRCAHRIEQVGTMCILVEASLMVMERGKEAFSYQQDD